MRITIAVLGVDSAGKTTIINALLGEPLDTAPTVGFTEEKVQHENYEITVFDLGGGKKIRDIWKNYLAELYGVIYVVDSSTRDRTAEVKENLTNLLQNPQVSGKPLLLLANKQDIEGHMEEVDICKELSLEELVNQNKCPCNMVTCSAIKGTGKKIDSNIKNGLTWLCNIIGQIYQKLEDRIAKDMEEVERKRQEENRLRAERVRKMKEERELKEAEEKKKSGFEEIDEEEEEEDMVDGDPFRRIDIDEIKKKEEKLKEAKRKKKEAAASGFTEGQQEQKEVNHKRAEVEEEEEDVLRFKKSSRTFLSYDHSNRDSLHSPIDDDRHKSDEQDEDSDNIVTLNVRGSRKKLPPLQKPLGTKFMEEDNIKEKNQKREKNHRTDKDQNNSYKEDHFSQSRKSLQSVSRTRVTTEQEISSGEEELRKLDSLDNSYEVPSKQEDGNIRTTGKKKKGKKKKGKFGQESFDTLRVPDEEAEEKSPGRHELKYPIGAEFLSETPEKKLRAKKKKKKFIKNSVAPSDDEFELSDVHNSPKDPLPWTRSPRKMLDNPDINVRSSKKWAIAEELYDEESSNRTRRPNYESEDDQIL
ncbi:hypothetical protein CHS0354_006748 [Potamilus streckersoni]|uniref:ADP-ribosylation factor-like protein 13B n=1 Tax=Potamilus streckersoni TaxID=2493646 RepID=A0AAE0RR97_9BIVA|nr:hypothetical protein CHS0354_006748 [Potamilus streckersoni]